MRLITVPEVAQLLNVSVPRAYELVRKQIIPSIRLGRQIRINAEEIQGIIRSKRAPVDDTLAETGIVPLERTPNV